MTATLTIITEVVVVLGFILARQLMPPGSRTTR
ncbi:hypothetical protein FHU39_004011 [Flexivirga oryzae]|uniref:Uncharacterized protein n=1 Tax=Flexivirga oryzae TaxID=1794944 RepID=A0A839NFQ7_9MICO|nr:hypothetical protein [Flexivirga oryzae]